MYRVRLRIHDSFKFINQIRVQWLFFRLLLHTQDHPHSRQRGWAVVQRKKAVHLVCVCWTLPAHHALGPLPTLALPAMACAPGVPATTDAAFAEPRSGVFHCDEPSSSTADAVVMSALKGGAATTAELSPARLRRVRAAESPSCGCSCRGCPAREGLPCACPGGMAKRTATSSSPVAEGARRRSHPISPVTAVHRVFSNPTWVDSDEDQGVDAGERPQVEDGKKDTRETTQLSHALDLAVSSPAKSPVRPSLASEYTVTPGDFIVGRSVLSLSTGPLAKIAHTVEPKDAPPALILSFLKERSPPNSPRCAIHRARPAEWPVIQGARGGA